MKCPSEQNEMAVSAARFLYAVAFELIAGRVFRQFYFHANEIKKRLAGLGYMLDALSANENMAINSSEAEWSPVRESDALALLCGFSGPTGSGYTSLRNITLRNEI